MSKYQAYSEYKNIDNKWLDKIPSHWEITHIKHILSMPITDGPHSTPIFLDEGIPFVSAEAVSSGRINFNKIRGYISEKDDEIFSQKYSPRLHDVYMIKSGATTGIAAIVETQKRFNIWSPLAVMRCKESFNPYFLLNSLRSDFFQKSVQLSWTFGTQQNIGMGTLENLTVCYPPLAEQTQIAAFLDHETAKIDTLIEKQQQLIELLKEKRQAVISHAVTKGLNPDTPMKDSGVEWLGEVPEHWDIMKFNHCAQIRSGQVNPLEDKYKDLILYAPNHIEKSTGKIIYKETANQQGADSNKYLCEKGEVIYSKIRPALAKVAICDEEVAMCSADMYPISAVNGLTNQFLFWFMLSDNFTKAVILDSDRVAMPKVNRESLGDYKIPVPLVSEQEEISNYITMQCKYFDHLEHKANSAIQLMQERRTALISAAVTGKIDVRHFTLKDGVAPTTSSDANKAQQKVTA